MTPADIITESLELLGCIAPGETVSSEEQASALHSLNSMLDAWSIDGFTVVATTRTTKVLSASTASYTIGTGGDINVTQPTRVDAAGLILSTGGLEYPINVLTTAQWENYYDKAGTVVTTIPRAVYFQPSSGTLGTIYPLPVPDNTHTLALYLPAQLTQIHPDAP